MGARLDSWKEIAAYLQRDVATVRRWEKREALPVHRHQHDKLGSVYAYSAELDVWAEGRRRQGPVDRPQRRRTLQWVAVGLFTAGLTLAISARPPWREISSTPPLRLKVELSPNVSLPISAVGAAVVLSPDGATLAFVAQRDENSGRQLYVRPLNRLLATPFGGTNDAESPFFSPDGLWIAFFAEGKLKKVSLAGGDVVTICDAPNGRGGAWAEDGEIVFAPDVARVSLQRVSSAGGKPEPLTSLAEGEVTQRWPQVLPGGGAVLYTGSSSPGDFSGANLVVQPLRGGARKIVQRAAYHGRYLSSGHLVYIHDGKLFAVPFDVKHLEITGQPVAALEGVSSSADTGGAQFSLATAGTLVYAPGQSVGSGAPIHWMDRDGLTTPLRPTVVNWSNLRFSPDGHRLALQVAGPGPSDIWLYDWTRDALTRLTSDPGFDSKPVWTPDGHSIAFASTRAGTSTLNLYWQEADGSREAQRLTESANQQRPVSWHPSGRFLAFEEKSPSTGWDLMILPLEGTDTSGWKAGKPWVFVNTSAAEREPMFSPDGRWVAYHSNESGRSEVYVRPFPGAGSKWQITNDGGVYPTWSQTRDEIVYSVNEQIMLAPFASDGESFHSDQPRLWPGGRYLERPGNRGFDVHPDGDRLGLGLGTAGQSPHGAQRNSVVFIFNFFDELRRLAPAKGN